MISRLLVIALCFFLAACGPNFKDESEELEHLNALSNPSASQFLRRKDLQAKADSTLAREHAESEAAIRRANEVREKEDYERTKFVRATAALEVARGWEGFAPESTITWYQGVVNRFPDTPEAEIARRRVAELQKLIDLEAKAKAGK